MENHQMERMAKEINELENALREERKQSMQHKQQAQQYETILSVILNCGSLDVAEIASMEHNFPGTTERAMDLQEEIDTNINFGLFVRAVQDIAIDQVEADLSDNQVDVLRDICIDDNYMAWGGIMVYGGSTDVVSEEAQQQFVEYVQTGAEEDKEAFLSLANGETVD